MIPMKNGIERRLFPHLPITYISTKLKIKELKRKQFNNLKEASILQKERLINDVRYQE